MVALINLPDLSFFNFVTEDPGNISPITLSLLALGDRYTFVFLITSVS